MKLAHLIRKILFLPILFIVSYGLLAQPAPIQKRRIALTLLNLSTDPNYGLSWMRTMRAAGCNTVVIPVLWQTVYPDFNSKPKWELFDNQLKLADELQMDIAIRIHVGRSKNKIDGFWAHSESQHDFKGEELALYWEATHPSFASKPAFQSVSKFVTEVCERYKPYLQKGRIFFVNVSFTPDQEAGFFYKNEQWPSPSYDCIFDHSDPSMADMRERLEKKYKTVNTLNKYWGTKFIEWKKVDPPANIYNTQANFRGKMGKDWWAVRHFQLKEYMDKLVDVIKKVDVNYKVAYDFGSLTDPQSLLRGTYAVKSLTEKADYVKHNDEDMDWSFDILRNNINKPIFNEVYHFANYTNDEVVKVMNWFFEEGSSMVCIIVADEAKDLEKARQAVERTRHWTDDPIQEITYTEKMDLYVSQLIDTYGDKFSRWKYLHDKGNRVKINLIEDILQEEKIDYLPYKTPDELSIEYGYYYPPPPPQGNGGGDITPPTVDPKDTVNHAPYAQRRFTPESVIVKQPFYFWLDSDIFVDDDGYISTIEMLEGPSWLVFRRDGFFFQGNASKIGEFKVVLKAYDNKGLSAIDSFYLNVEPPVINFQVIEADYFDIPIRYLGPLTDGKEMYLEDMPNKINFLAECNVDSITVSFELKGPYYYQSESEKRPFNIFGEGKGMFLPIGKYTLLSKAYKGDSVITSKSVSFRIKDKRGEIPLLSWTTYPNPFKDVCNLIVPAQEEIQQLTFALKDVLGRNYVVTSEMLTTVEKTVYINFRKFQLQHGTYFLEIKKNEEIIEVKRIVKE